MDSDSRRSASRSTCVSKGCAWCDAQNGPQFIALIPACDTTGDAASSDAVRDQFISDHLWLVLSLARKIQQRLPRSVLIEDLHSAGVVGLLDAVDKFDSSKSHFHPYAERRVRGAIIDSLRLLDWSPRSLRRKARSVEQATNALVNQHGRTPTELEIAERLNMDVASYHQLRGKLDSLEVGGLHSPQSEEPWEEDAIMRVPARPEDDPLYECLRSELQRKLVVAIAGLPEREHLVVTLHYYAEMSTREIGLIMGLERSKVRQAHVAALHHLRTNMGGHSTPKPPRWPTS